ncbi:MAG: hypothetical protein MK116_08640 [Phycisphaerales bacterium]|nr:hypothetical protein [Phycisphaerales bacterium]
MSTIAQSDSRKLRVFGALSTFFIGIGIVFMLVGGAFVAAGTWTGFYGMETDPEMFTFAHVGTGAQSIFAGAIWIVIGLAVREVRGSLLRIENWAGATARD